MKLILKHDISDLGKIGDVVQVKDGYARNFLLPRKHALIATANNLKKIEFEKKRTEKLRTLDRQKAMELALRLSSLSVTITVEVNEEEKMYGSLTAADIAKAISQEGVEVDKKLVLLDKPLKDLGIYDVTLKLYGDICAQVKVWIVKK